MSQSTQCKGLWDHSMDKLDQISITQEEILKRCPKCGYEEVFPHSRSNVYFVSNSLQQKKKWAADDNRRELLQPDNPDGSPNEEFTEAYGYNPLDPRTKHLTPKIQGGLA